MAGISHTGGETPDAVAEGKTHVQGVRADHPGGDAEVSSPILKGPLEGKQVLPSTSSWSEIPIPGVKLPVKMYKQTGLRGPNVATKRKLKGGEYYFVCSTEM